MDAIAAVRRFNRFYTQKIGVLREDFLHSPFSLAESRVLYELAHHEETTAAELAVDLGLDAGYLSRILTALHKKRLVRKKRSDRDGRKSLLALTRKGQKSFARINAASQREIGAMLDPLSAAEKNRLVHAMEKIESFLDAAPEHGAAYLLRPPQPGDMGWVVQRHGVLYAQEYGWDEKFEALVAEIVARFVQHLDPKRERCWIAEVDGENVGCVFLVKRSKTISQLRLLLVEPKARGLGIGTRLVDECIRFARLAGYKKMILWTNDVLLAARHIYEKFGFELAEEERHHSFGHDLVGQTWALSL
jgi:DNA-binding MarR family transcriptional regulator/N-acetylglutamate synthase-like GNAT family acetyltransferase